LAAGLLEVYSVTIAGIRLRLILLILFTQAVIIYWVADSEIVGGIYLICYSIMMPTAIYLLAVRVLRRWLPFTDRELLVGYIVLTATIPIVGFGGLRFIIEGMGYIRFFSETQPQWLKYVSYLSKLPVLQDSAAVQGLYRGGTSVPWAAWTVPIAFWSAYLLALSGIWLSLAGILRHVWIKHERLTFPVAMLPLQLTDKRNDIFRRPVFWIGFAIPAILQSLLAIHEWVPAVPAIQLKAFNLAPMIFSSPPWNAVRDLSVGFYPMAVGLAYLVPSNVSFSCWFFAIIVRLFCVVCAMFGMDTARTKASRFPYYEEQASGAWVAFAVLVLWSARKHIRSAAKSLSPEDRAAVGKLWVSALVCTAICTGMIYSAGLPLVMAGAVVFIYAAYVLTGARVRAEAGGQWTFSPLWSAHDASSAILGTGGLSQGALVSTGFFDLVHVDIRGQSLPYLMEGMDIAEKTGTSWRTILIWVGIGTVTALALGWWCTLSKLYAVGAATAKANPYPVVKAAISFGDVDRLAANPKARDLAGVTAMTIGACITCLLAWIGRLGVPGLHPVGYIMANTRTMQSFIVPFFMAWLVKTIVLRYGGNRFYRRTVPFFIGVMLGDVTAQATWALVGGIFHVPIYQFLT